MSKRHTVSAPTPEDEALRARAAADHIRQSPDVEFTPEYRALANIEARIAAKVATEGWQSVALPGAPPPPEAEDFSD